MNLTNPLIFIPLVWLSCTIAYFVAAFWLPRPDFAVPETAASVGGILVIWWHEIMRSAPVLIPGFGVFWGILSSIGFAHASFFVIENGIISLSPGHMIVMFPFLSLYMLAQCIMIRRGLLLILTLMHRNDMEEMDSPYHESAVASAWDEQQHASHGSSFLRHNP